MCASTSFVYGSNNQLTAMGSVNFTYDNNGNELTMVNGSQSWGYGYDYANRLINVTLNSQPVQTNLYESNGNRVLATDNGSSVVYVYQGSNIIYEKNMTSGQVTDHFYADGLQVANLMSNGTVQYFHEDALGSIRLVTTGTSGIAFSSNYAPFGVSVSETGIEGFQYTDKPVDSITGLYYLGARFYDSEIYRFITEDSDTGTIADPLNLNLYIYTEDNPEKYIDPNGHMYAHPLFCGGGSPPTSTATNTGNSIGSGLSSTANSFINEQVSEATSMIESTANGVNSAISTVVNGWNSLPVGERQAIVVSAACIGAAAIAVVSCGGVTPLSCAMVGAATCSTGYTLATQGKATLGGVVANAFTGFVTAGLTAGAIDTFGLTGTAGMVGLAGNVGANLLGDTFQNAIDGTSSFNPNDLIWSSAFSTLSAGSSDTSFHFSDAANDVGNNWLSSSASRLPIISPFSNPSQFPGYQLPV